MLNELLSNLLPWLIIGLETLAIVLVFFVIFLVLARIFVPGSSKPEDEEDKLATPTSPPAKAEGKESKGWIWRGALALVVIALLAYIGLEVFVPWAQHALGRVTADEAPTCTTLTRQTQECVFGNKERMWVSTGDEVGPMSCIYPLPYFGEYSLQYKHTPDGEAKTWEPGITESVSAYGFLALGPKPQKVKAVLADSAKDCPAKPG